FFWLSIRRNNPSHILAGGVTVAGVFPISHRTWATFSPWFLRPPLRSVQCLHVVRPLYSRTRAPCPVPSPGTPHRQGLGLAGARHANPVPICFQLQQKGRRKFCRAWCFP